MQPRASEIQFQTSNVKFEEAPYKDKGIKKETLKRLLVTTFYDVFYVYLYKLTKVLVNCINLSQVRTCPFYLWNTGKLFLSDGKELYKFNS